MRVFLNYPKTAPFEIFRNFVMEALSSIAKAVNNVDYDQALFARHSVAGVSTAANGSYTITYDKVMAKIPVVIPTLVDGGTPIQMVRVKSQTTAGGVIQLYDSALGSEVAAVAVNNVWVMEKI